MLSTISGVVEDGLDFIDSGLNKLPLGIGGVVSFLGPKKLKMGMGILSFMGDIDGSLNVLDNIDDVCRFDRTGAGLSGSTLQNNEQTAESKRSGPFVHRRRRRTARRLFEEQNTTAIHELFSEINSQFDWSGTTHCAKIGQVKTPPQTPYEIATWTSCAEYRIRASAISSVLEVPSNIFDDWYTIAEWSSLMIVGGLQYMTTNSTIEDLTYAGYPGTAIMQVTEGAKKMYTGLSNKFSVNTAIDATFASTGIDTQDLKSIVNDLPALQIPKGGSEFRKTLSAVHKKFLTWCKRLQHKPQGYIRRNRVHHGEGCY